MIIEKLRAMLWGAGGVAAAALLLPAAPGCGERDEPGMTKKAVPLDELPKPVGGAAARALRGVTLGEAWKNYDRDGNLRSYEVRGRVPSSGKIREVRVSTTGTILEEE